MMCGTAIDVVVKNIEARYDLKCFTPNGSAILENKGIPGNIMEIWDGDEDAVLIEGSGLFRAMIRDVIYDGTELEHETLCDSIYLACVSEINHEIYEWAKGQIRTFPVHVVGDILVDAKTQEEAENMARDALKKAGVKFSKDV